MPSLPVVILAGGRGTRLSEETHAIPKPMVEIGGRPIIWHVMKHYARFGFSDFIVACGYKGHVIKEYFANYRRHSDDVRVDLGTGRSTFLTDDAENWTVTLVDTGSASLTGGRIGRLRHLLPGRFLLTYGDGVSDVPIPDLIAHHEAKGAALTVTAVGPPPRFGVLDISDGMAVRFAEKPQHAHDRINGGFFVVEPEVLDLITGDDCVFETGPMQTLAAAGRLAAYEHDGFWMPMDTLRDRDELDQLARQTPPPWLA
ncbi:MAG: glucose-1-phosphate cytidylyltransferase [Aeromicrobium sp.]